MNINLILGDETARAVLADNATSRDFVALLPMTVMLEDFPGKEKIQRLSKGLSTSGQLANQPASVWDIAFYRGGAVTL